MSNKLKCPFCGEELAPHIDEWKSIRKLFICNNTGCFCWGHPMLLEILQALISGKKAQRQLRTAKDRCIKKIKAKEREIAKYLNGISVRGKEIQNLREQLQKTQDAIQKIKDIVYPALDKEFYSELRDDMLDIGSIIVSVEKREE